MTRVAVITTAHPALDGRIFHKEATTLAAAGHAVTLIAPNGPDVDVEVKRAGMDFVGLPADVRRRARPRRWLAMARELWHSRHTHEVWHFHDPELLALCVVLRAMLARRVSLVYDAHENYAGTIGYKDWLPNWSGRPVTALTAGVEGFLARRCELVVAATEPIAEHQRSRAVDRIVVVRNYPRISGTRFEQDPSYERQLGQAVRLVYAGSITAARGVWEMLEADTLLDDIDVELHLAGTFGTQKLEADVRAAASDRVHVHGALPWQQVPDLLRSCDIGLVVLHPEPNYVDSLPTKLFEYFAAGLPVVASNFEAWDEFVSRVDTGLQVDPLDAGAIAAAVRTLSSSPERFKAMARQARALALDRFSWQAEAATLAEAYVGIGAKARQPVAVSARASASAPSRGLL